MENYYKLLSLKVSSSRGEIENNLHDLQDTYNNIRNNSSGDLKLEKHADEKLQQITEALRIFGSDESRKQYDRILLGGISAEKVPSAGKYHPTEETRGSVALVDKQIKREHPAPKNKDSNPKSSVPEESLREDQVHSLPVREEKPCGEQEPKEENRKQDTGTDLPAEGLELLQQLEEQRKLREQVSSARPVLLKQFPWQSEESPAQNATNRKKTGPLKKAVVLLVIAGFLCLSGYTFYRAILVKNSLIGDLKALPETDGYGMVMKPDEKTLQKFSATSFRKVLDGFAFQGQNGKYGLVSSKLSYFYPAEFDQVGEQWENNDSQLWIKQNGKWGVLNTTSGQTVLPFQYDSYLGKYVYQNGKWQEQGTEKAKMNTLYIIPLRAKDAPNPNSRTIYRCDNGKDWYDGADGNYADLLDEKTAGMNTVKQSQVPYPTSDGSAVVIGRTGNTFYDYETGKVIPAFQDLYFLNNSTFAALHGSEWKFYDDFREDSTISSLIGNKPIQKLAGSTEDLAVYAGGKWFHIINQKGKFIVDNTFYGKRVLDVRQIGHQMFYRTADGWGMKDYDGDHLDYIKPVNGEPVNRGGNEHYIRNGKMQIEETDINPNSIDPNDSKASRFIKNCYDDIEILGRYVCVKKSGLWGWYTAYNNAYSFVDCTFSVCWLSSDGKQFFAQKNGLWYKNGDLKSQGYKSLQEKYSGVVFATTAKGIVDVITESKFSIPKGYKDITPIESSDYDSKNYLFSFLKDGKMGIVNSSGEIDCPPKYEKITILDDDNELVTRSGIDYLRIYDAESKSTFERKPQKYSPSKFLGITLY